MSSFLDGAQFVHCCISLIFNPKLGFQSIECCAMQHLFRIIDVICRSAARRILPSHIGFATPQQSLRCADVHDCLLGIK